MFVHDNGKVLTLSISRCGHTSMYTYFGLEEYSFEGKVDILDWINSKSESQRVIVLRNPYDRVRSAQQNLAHCLDSLGSLPIEEERWFYNHSYPYLHTINHCNFKYIDFYKLQNYLETVSKKTIKSKVSCNEGSKFYIPNNYYREQDLDNEFFQYEKILAEREEMSVEEWKELTR